MAIVEESSKGNKELVLSSEQDVMFLDWKPAPERTDREDVVEGQKTNERVKGNTMSLELAMERERAYQAKIERLQAQPRYDCREPPFAAQVPPSNMGVVGMNREAPLENLPHLQGSGRMSEPILPEKELAREKLQAGATLRKVTDDRVRSIIPVEYAIQREVSSQKSMECLKPQPRHDFKDPPASFQGSALNVINVGMKRKAPTCKPVLMPPNLQLSYNQQHVLPPAINMPPKPQLSYSQQHVNAPPNVQLSYNQQRVASSAINMPPNLLASYSQQQVAAPAINMPPNLQQSNSQQQVSASAINMPQNIQLSYSQQHVAAPTINMPTNMPLPYDQQCVAAPAIGLYCKQCQVSCSSSLTLKQHLRGKKHRTTMRELTIQNKNKSGQPGIPPTGSQKASVQIQSAPILCQLCMISCINEDCFQQHLKGKKHTSSLQAIANANANPITG